MDHIWQIYYERKQYNSRDRNIDFEFSLEQFKQKWQTVDRLLDDSLYLCRINEPGPYSYDNTYIGTAMDNAQDASRNGRLKANSFNFEVDGIAYESIAQASRALNISYSTMMHLAKQPQPVKYKGKTYNMIKGDRSMKTPTRYTDKYL